MIVATKLARGRDDLDVTIGCAKGRAHNMRASGVAMSTRKAHSPGALGFLKGRAELSEFCVVEGAISSNESPLSVRIRKVEPST